MSRLLLCQPVSWVAFPGWVRCSRIRWRSLTRAKVGQKFSPHQLARLSETTITQSSVVRPEALHYGGVRARDSAVCLLRRPCCRRTHGRGRVRADQRADNPSDLRPDWPDPCAGHPRWHCPPTDGGYVRQRPARNGADLARFQQSRPRGLLPSNARACTSRRSSSQPPRSERFRGQRPHLSAPLR